MQPRSLSHLSDRALVHEIKSLVARDRTTTAELLAHLAEFDVRKLYRPDGYSSLYEYCVQELGMSGDAACDRIEAARAARRNPGILAAIAEGRLHLTGVVMLARYLEQAPQLAEDLLRAAERRTKSEIAMLIATRFPREDVPTSLRPIGATLATPAAMPVSGEALLPLGPPASEGSTPAGHIAPAPLAPALSVPERMEFLENSALSTRSTLPPPASRPTIAPLSAERYELRGTISRRFHEKLVRIQELLSHAVPSGDLIEVLERCADAFLERAERTGPSGAPKSKAGDTPAAADPDHRRVPLELRRVVMQRDGGQCTFVSHSGRRCASRKRLECDHIVPVAKGGHTTLDNLRLLCHSHNQHMAEDELGREFMLRISALAEESRESARARARADANAAARAAAPVSEPASAQAPAQAPHTQDEPARSRSEVVRFLVGLGYSREHAARGGATGDSLPDAPLDQRVRFAMDQLGPDPDRITLHAAHGTG